MPAAGDRLTTWAALSLPEGTEVVDASGCRYVADGVGGFVYPVLGVVYDGEELVRDDGPLTLVAPPIDYIPH